MELRGKIIESPIGPMLLAVDAEEVLVAVEFLERHEPDALVESWRKRGDSLRFCEDAASEAACQLREYFTGERTHFDLEMRPQGTVFQQKVWRALCDIPYGVCQTYRDVAHTIGAPKAVRAVGAANGRNPIPIIIPCHRVIGSNGHLTGYGGGLEIKAELLKHEGYSMF